MSQSPFLPRPLPVARLAIIAVVIGAVAVIFAYTAGWLSPNRLTPAKFVTSLAPPGGPALGDRRDHAKGVCSPEHLRPTATARRSPKRGYSCPASIRWWDASTCHCPTQCRGRNGARTRPRHPHHPAGWAGMAKRHDRCADLPVSTVQGFYDLQMASKSGPEAMRSSLPGIPDSFLRLVGQDAPWTASYAEERTTVSIFVFIDGSGARRPVRWSLVPAAQPVPISPDGWQTWSQFPGAGDDSACRDRPSTLEHGGNGCQSGGSHGRSEQAGLMIAAPSRLARSLYSKSSPRLTALPRHQLRSDRPACRHDNLG